MNLSKTKAVQRIYKPYPVDSSLSTAFYSIYFNIILIHTPIFTEKIWVLPYNTRGTYRTHFEIIIKWRDTIFP